MIIDGTNQLLGRIATIAAKAALHGEDVIILNSQDIIISGKRSEVIANYKKRAARGTHSTGPFIPRMPDRFVKRAIRGMLPYKKPRGRDALNKIRCFVGVPTEYVDKEMTQFEGANLTKLPEAKYISVKDITKVLGAK
ncbi:MAG: 50S ribosomal protein L13 [Candidatus Woesearchaeota archaeon]|nr:MAG: 50S ribosomal protein L13 [Candidatus Woesearchaeota archaeon]